MEIRKTVATPGADTGAAQGIASEINVIEAIDAIQQTIAAAIRRLDRRTVNMHEWNKIEHALALLSLLPKKEEVLLDIKRHSNSSPGMLKGIYQNFCEAPAKARALVAAISEGAGDE